MGHIGSLVNRKQECLLGYSWRGLKPMHKLLTHSKFQNTVQGFAKVLGKFSKLDVKLELNRSLTEKLEQNC